MYIYIYIRQYYTYNHMYIYIYMWGCPKLCTRKLPLRRALVNLSRPFAPFRAPAESGHGNMIALSFIYRFINSGIQTFREPPSPFRGLSPLQQNIHIHIRRCHSDTKSLAWVLGRLPIIYVYIYICINLLWALGSFWWWISHRNMVVGRGMGYREERAQSTSSNRY